MKDPRLRKEQVNKMYSQVCALVRLVLLATMCSYRPQQHLIPAAGKNKHKVENVRLKLFQRRKIT